MRRMIDSSGCTPFWKPSAVTKHITRIQSDPKRFNCRSTEQLLPGWLCAAQTGTSARVSSHLLFKQNTSPFSVCEQLSQRRLQMSLFQRLSVLHGGLNLGHLDWKTFRLSSSGVTGAEPSSQSCLQPKTSRATLEQNLHLLKDVW